MGEEEKRKRKRKRKEEERLKMVKEKRKNDGAGGQASPAMIGLRDGWMELVTETVEVTSY